MCFFLTNFICRLLLSTDLENYNKYLTVCVQAGMLENAFEFSMFAPLEFTLEVMITSANNALPTDGHKTISDGTLSKTVPSFSALKHVQQSLFRGYALFLFHYIVICAS